jgi:hypothetical protein
MNKVSRLLAVCFVGMCSGIAAAQGNTILRVLQISRAYVKRGKAGIAHDKAESAFVQAMSHATWPMHDYPSATSEAEVSRGLYGFLVGTGRPPNSPASVGGSNVFRSRSLTITPQGVILNS